MKLLFRPTPSQERILFALARHKFLTTSQFLRLSVSSTTSNLSRSFKELKTRKFVSSEGFAQAVRTENKYRYRKLESFYYLTKKGVLLVMERLRISEDKVKYPKGHSNFFNQNYWHRKYIIDCEIEAIHWAKSKGYKLMISDREFDKAGSNRKGRGFSKTRIAYNDKQYIIPDANFILFNGTDYKLFTLELHHQKSARAIANQLAKHVLALKNGGVGLRYKINKLHRVLNVFVEEAKMKRVMKYLQEMEAFKGMEKFFLFKHLAQVIPQRQKDDQGKIIVKVCNFYDAWLNFSGEPIDTL